jgi:hypothetical protein
MSKNDRQIQRTGIAAMTGRKRPDRKLAWFGCGLLALPVLAGMTVEARAQPATAAAADQGGNAMVHLIQLMVKNGQLTREQAEPLLREAGQEGPATKRAHAAKASPPAAGAVAPPETTAAPPGSVRVTYVPELVRQQIAAEVKQQVMQEAQDEGWAEPNALPEWTQRIRIFGDIRMRGEEDMLSGNNFPGFTDFNAINGSANGFDTSTLGSAFPPTLNTTQNRTRFRLRARLGADAQINDWVSTEIRIGTGNDRNPVSENQTLGAGGDFSKYAIWLDRAYIRLKPTTWLSFDVGRGPNPFWTTPLLFNEDLNFDGISVHLEHAIVNDVTGFLSAGAFPVFNTAFNFGSTSTSTTQNNSHDSYLLALQAGGEWKISSDYLAKMAFGYFNFLNVQGSQSTPCLAPVANGSCNTDNQTPGFVQFGNTLFPLRNILPNPSSGTVTSTPEFFGLASRFNVADVHGEFSVLNFHPVDIVFTGDFVKNFGFNASAIAARGPSNNFGSNNAWSGSDTGYLVQVGFGHQQLERLWDWNFTLGYRYIGSDAVLDALNDSDFHLGGTNAKGYTVAGNLALDRNVWFGAKFYSATQVSGQPYTADVLLVDLNAKF